MTVWNCKEIICKYLQVKTKKLPRERVTFPGIGFIGYYKNGLPHGHVWMETIGGGLLHGKVDEKDYKLTGNNVSFVFPDRNTLFHGKFIDRKMVCARDAKLNKIRCEHGLPVIDEVEIVDKDTNYFYQPRTNETFGGGPYGVTDPYERNNFEVKQSAIPGSGEGEF